MNDMKFFAEKVQLEQDEKELAMVCDHTAKILWDKSDPEIQSLLKDIGRMKQFALVEI